MHLPFWTLPLLVFVAQWTPTDRSRRLIEAMRTALSRSRVSDKEAAYIQGMVPTQWARQLALRDGAHPSLARVAELPDDVLCNFVEVLGAELGLHVVRDEKLTRLLDKLDAIDIRMASMDLQKPDKRSA